MCEHCNNTKHITGDDHKKGGGYIMGRGIGEDLLKGRHGEHGSGKKQNKKY